MMYIVLCIDIDVYKIMCVCVSGMYISLYTSVRHINTSTYILLLGTSMFTAIFSLSPEATSITSAV